MRKKPLVTLLDLNMHRWHPRTEDNAEGIALHEQFCTRCGLAKGDFFVHNLPNLPRNAALPVDDMPSCDTVIVQRIMES